MHGKPERTGVRAALIAWLATCVWAAPVAAPRPAADGQRADRVEAVRTWTSPRVDVVGLLAEDELRRADGLPLRVGLPMDTRLAPSNSGTWEALPDGDRVWRLRARTEGALWTVLGFDLFRPLPGAELRVYDPSRHRVVGPFTHRHARPDGELWLPPIDGDTLVVELLWPAHLADLEPEIRLGTVSHGYRPWTGMEDTDPSLPQTRAPEEAGACNIDVNCALGDGLQRQKRGVVKLMIGGGFMCSGSLINNSDLDCKPYVLTAEHCYDDEGTSPGNTTFFFNFERPACEPGTVIDDQWISGSTLRASHDPTDYRLLELSQSPPADFDVFYNGWSRSTVPASEAWTIHHPGGEVKKISYSDDPLVDGDFEGPDHWRVDDWEQGTSDPGSSGGPLFDQDLRIVGQLNLDTASCSNPGGWVEFGKLDVSWDNGLAALLDPAGSGVLALDGMDQSFCGAPAPRLSHDGHVVHDGQDGKADPGENFLLEVQLLNDGPLSATGVTGTLSSAHPSVSVLDEQAVWSDIAPLQSLSSTAPHFEIDLSSDFVCGDSIPFQLSVSANEGSWPSAFLLGTGTVVGPAEPPPFADDMENGPNGWTTALLAGSSTWSLNTGESNSPTHSWHVPNVTGVHDSVLIMPTVDSVPPDATLSFAHLMDSDTGDGGVLEYSTDGSTFVDAGDLITEGPYNSEISDDFSSPIGGRLAWAGDLGGWRTVQVDLSSLEDQELTLRWRFASDDFTGGVGWYVDDVVLDAPVFACCPDFDGDGSCPPPNGSDCDDANGDVYPGAPQICDGLNNDCDDPEWPALPANESDVDGDGMSSCAGDCNGADATVRPGLAEVCDGYDNDCNGLVDDDSTCEGICAPAEPAGGEIQLATDPAASNDPNLVWTGAEYGLVWSDLRDGNFEVYFSRLGTLGQSLGGEVQVTNAPLDSENPSIAWTGSAYGVTWCDDRSGTAEVYFTRLDAAGNKIGSDVVLGGCTSPSGTALVWNGFEYAVAWEDRDSEIQFARLDAAGNPIGSQVRMSNGSGTAAYPDLAWSGSGYGLVWHAVDGSFNQIYFTRIETFGDEIGEEVAVTENSVESRRPSLVWADSGYGVVWQEGSGGPLRTIHLARLDPVGNVVDGITQVTDGATGSRRPAIAWTGEAYGVAWRDLRDGNGEIYFAHVEASGVKLGEDLRLSDSPADSTIRTLVWSGVDFGVVWDESPDVKFTRVGCNCTDSDADGRTSCEDNCASVYNPGQSDLDFDAEGDHCDLDDGLIYVLFSTREQVGWQEELGFDGWNAYKGDLNVLKADGLYTQAPGSNAIADRACGLPVPAVDDPDPPPVGQTAFFLVSGVAGGLEGALGVDSSGAPRPNDNSCP